MIALGKLRRLYVMLSVIGKLKRWWTSRRQDRETQSDGLFLALWCGWLVLSFGRRMSKERFGICVRNRPAVEMEMREGLRRLSFKVESEARREGATLDPSAG